MLAELLISCNPFVSFRKINKTMEFLGSLLEIGQLIWAPIVQWLRYSRNLNENIRRLKRKIDDLSVMDHDINAEVMHAELRLGKRRKKEVEVWMEKVQNIKGDMRKIELEATAGSNYISRARLGKLVEEKLEEVEELQLKGTFSDGLTIHTATNLSLTIPIAPMGGGDTAEKNMRKIWTCLMDDEVQKIGVFGMGGAGKTTIMHRINNQLLRTTGNVIWVTVSQAFSVPRLQKEIAEALHLDLSDLKDETRRASRLYAMLVKTESYVLILDDLWEAFPLEKVGIPEPTRVNGCKLVVTTRSLEVCRKMECKPIQVELLTEQEALDLFFNKVGSRLAFSADVLKIVELMAAECACLPLAIVTVAGSMKGVDDIHEWRNALHELVNSTEGTTDMETIVFERLKFSYCRLKDATLQQCFLYCALYPEDHKISRTHLIEYWINENLINDRIGEQAAIDKGHTLLNNLVNSCLLEVCDGRHVKIHDVVRDMAIKITKVTPQFMVKAGLGLTESLAKDWSEDLERVSLMYNKIEHLSFTPSKCQRITTLLLQHNPLTWVSDSFFCHMHALKVLDLSYTLIEFLPVSLSLLENLREISLDHCIDLSYVSSLANLKALRELKLGYTKILKLPAGMDELVNLKSLDLYHTRHLESFLGDKAAHLSHLKCLRIDLSNVKVSAEELMRFKELKILGAAFHSLKEFNKYAESPQCQELSNYRLVLGNDDDRINEIGKEVLFHNCHLMSRGEAPLVLPSSIQVLKIVRCHDIKSLTEISSLKNAKELRTCYVKFCIGIESIFHLKASVQADYSPTSLVRLTLYDLPNLKVVFSGVAPYGAYFNLKQLTIYRCSNLWCLFPSKSLSKLTNLQCLSVIDCDRLESIVVDELDSRNAEEHRSSTKIFPRLEHLKLMDLPVLKSICCKGLMLCSSIREIEVFDCMMLKRLPLSVDMENRPTTPRYIFGQEEWWDSLMWDELDDVRLTLQSSFRKVDAHGKDYFRKNLRSVCNIYCQYNHLTM